MTNATATRPASPKQIDLIHTLLAERDVPAPDFDYAADVRMASGLIDLLFRAPRKATAQATPGYYLADGAVIRVQANRAGTGTYAKRLVIDAEGHKGTWTYAPGLGATLATSEPLTVEAAAALGHTYGVCVVCGRELTNPASVEAGIGPVCSSRLG